VIRGELRIPRSTWDDKAMKKGRLESQPFLVSNFFAGEGARAT